MLSKHPPVENETHFANSQNHSWIDEGLLYPPENFRGLDLASWKQWLVDAFPGLQHVEWLMGQVDRVGSELDVTNRQAQWILGKCLRRARIENQQSRLPGIVSEAIEIVSRP